jgi:hypothetical protein
LVTRWDVASLELRFLAVVLLGIHIPEVHTLSSGVAVRKVCRFLTAAIVSIVSAGGIRLAGVQVEVDVRGATSEVDGAGGMIVAVAGR